MTDETAKACINLNAVLRCMEHLCALDDEAKNFIQPLDLTLQFSIQNGPAARLIFMDGSCEFAPGKGECTVALHFSSFTHFNKMMDGSAMPMITKGFTKLSFLTKQFTFLTNRLAYYLKPTPELLQREKFKEINTILTFYTAFYALAQIGMHDPVGREVMKKDRRGIFCASIEGTGHSVMLKMAKGLIEPVKEDDGSPKMYLSFSGVQKTYDILNGVSDFLTAIGTGDVKIKGYMPLMQSVELLVPRIAAYLK